MSKMEEFLKSEGNTFPGKTYIEELLKPVFNDQRDFLFEAMFDIHRAHVIMLKEQKIIELDAAKTMLDGINRVARMDQTQLTYESQYEDLFFMMEAKMADEIGEELAGNIHIGRSRNDMGVAMYRLVLRDHLLELVGNCDRLCEVLLMQAESHHETYMTAYTHTQPAQPTTLGHYLLGIYDILQRDIERLWSAYSTVNQSPLGAAALTTTGFPIDRIRTCELLGFDKLVENSYDCISGADYLIETATALMSCMVNTGRWIQDFLQHVTREYNSFLVADPYVQVSSIMPQKRNPVSIEHSRALASSAYGDALAAIQMIHNTPFGDIVDTEDDLQPHLYRAFTKANRVAKLMYAVIMTIKVNKEHLRTKAQNSTITITELADTLTRDHGVSFRKAHKIASFIAKQTQVSLSEWNVDEINGMIKEFAAISLTEEEWKKIISVEHFVSIRTVQGGPSPTEVMRMIGDRQEKAQQNGKQFDEMVRVLSVRRKSLRNFKF